MPSQSSVSVEVRHCKMTSKPGLVCSNIHNCSRATQIPLEPSSSHNIPHNTCLTINPQVKIQNLFPHRCQIDQMSLLSEILLTYLQLHRGVCLLEIRKQRTDRFSNLEI